MAWTVTTQPERANHIQSLKTMLRTTPTISTKDAPTEAIDRSATIFVSRLLTTAQKPVCRRRATGTPPHRADQRSVIRRFASRGGLRLRLTRPTRSLLSGGFATRPIVAQHLLES